MLPDDPYQVKWAILALHNAAMAFFILAIPHASPLPLISEKAFKKYILKAQETNDTAALMEDFYLADFLTLFIESRMSVTCRSRHQLGALADDRRAGRSYQTAQPRATQIRPLLRRWVAVDTMIIPEDIRAMRRSD